MGSTLDMRKYDPDKFYNSFMKNFGDFEPLLQENRVSFEIKPRGKMGLIEPIARIRFYKDSFKIGDPMLCIDYALKVMKSRSEDGAGWRWPKERIFVGEPKSRRLQKLAYYLRINNLIKT